MDVDRLGVVVGLFALVSSVAQTPTPARRQFEVASIRKNNSGPPRVFVDPFAFLPGGRFTGPGASRSRCGADRTGSMPTGLILTASNLRYIEKQRNKRGRAESHDGKSRRDEVLGNASHWAGTVPGAPLSFTKNTKNLAGLVLLAFLDTV